MAFNRPPAMAFPDQRYLQPFQPKNPDPLSDNWTYDSAIDLFSLNTMPDPFTLDLPEDLMNFDPRDVPVDAFAPPPGISGFSISNHSGEDAASCGSISSDPESDDQLWSPTCRAISSLDTDMSQKPQSQSQPRRKTNPRKRQQPARYSSSPEITPQEYHPELITSSQPTPSSPSNQKMTRSLSGDSNASTGAGTNPVSRNAAKRAAHNIIEKRYRTNMNAKFVSLEKAMAGSGSSGVHKPATKGSASLKKSEILSNAISYMEELQEENKRLHKEMAVMRQNLLPGGIWRHSKPSETNFG
ncbi:hypothetical protein ASPWEDRAFT_30368 [Aspergillus wentii DTO 134E9]|uniref:BHLH domain-containing protein n=1 Tax=Aspergillus wentii DTO 134E9 TaxID=1073089 RepID=A0A1L9REC3_ASPWE|nr:uncharacterized protein ASPWEDRAFT_30368 [Aspergillus wentii DTO 134E9]KAI9933525.1 hypothetical protein MW887_007998 [Aspergillus wentii]OJJ33271.1 hypothetical protein ASPWEDRAFT_30368 [Aspergillus wentii DTO 134E9]